MRSQTLASDSITHKISKITLKYPVSKKTLKRTLKKTYIIPYVELN